VKGFVYTLEAIIASGLLLGVVLTVLPQAQTVTDVDMQGQAYEGLETLHESGEFDHNISNASIEKKIDPYLADSFNYSVSVTEVEEESREISSPYEEHFDGNGSSSELQLWIDNANNLDITFAGNTVLSDRDSAGYKEVSLSKTEGWLNFTGTGELEFHFDSYKTDGDTVTADNVFATSYIAQINGTKQIRVKTWE